MDDLTKHDPDEFPQQGCDRMIMPQPISLTGTGLANPEREMLARVDGRSVFMMGDNPQLPRMPERPQLLDFYRLRFTPVTLQHLLSSAKRALDDGQSETIVLACLLHDISNGCLLRADHGYWGAQLIAPYVSEEIAFAVQYHQALRYVADEQVGYHYPESYDRFFGADFTMPDYLKRDADYARQHKFYMSARIVTLNDIYFFDDQTPIDPELFSDIIGRHFKTPAEGLGFDQSPSAHMWRTMIWPNNFL